MSFKEERFKSIAALRAAGEPPKGHHWSAGYDREAQKHTANPRKTIVSKGGLVLHRLDSAADVGPNRGKYAIVDRESGLAWVIVGHRGLASSIVKRHGAMWVDILREVEDAVSARPGERVEHLRKWMSYFMGLASLYRRADPGEDDGGIAYDVEDRNRTGNLPNYVFDDATTFGLGVGSGFRGPLLVLSRKADGSPRAWARQTYTGWARFDAGARNEDEYFRYMRQNMGRGDVLVREFKSLKRALAANGWPKDGDRPPNVALLKLDLPEKPKTTKEDFRRAFVDAMTRAIAKNPAEYAFGVEHVPEVADRMVDALAKGKACLGPSARAAARACGIRPTLSAIRIFMSA